MQGERTVRLAEAKASRTKAVRVSRVESELPAWDEHAPCTYAILKRVALCRMKRIAGRGSRAIRTVRARYAYQMRSSAMQPTTAIFRPVNRPLKSSATSEPVQKLTIPRIRLKHVRYHGLL